MLLKEEPDDGPRCIQKVPSLSDLSEESCGEYRYLNLLSFFSFQLKYSVLLDIIKI